jgi:hypothetical protein
MKAAQKFFVAQELAHSMRSLTCDRSCEDGRMRSFEWFTGHVECRQIPSHHRREKGIRMNGECRREFQRGQRVVHVSDAQPDTDPGGAQSASKVKEITGAMEQMDGAQRAGLIDVHAAALEKRKLRGEILAGPIAHLAEVGRLAGRDDHQLASVFRFKPSADTYVAFRTAAGNMRAEAEAHKEVLLRHGLSEPVLAMLGEQLDRFDAAVALGVAGRSTHKGATKQLQALASELGTVIRVMDARNRQRFQGNAELLEAWISASMLQGVKRGVTPAEVPAPSGTPEAGGEQRPAA